MIQDFSYLLYWWMEIFFLGLLVWPLTKRLFSRFFDLGYPFAKILGILLLSYLTWLLGSLKILPFFRETVLLIITILVLVNYLILRRFDLLRGRTSAKTSSKLKILIFEEVLFFLALLFWSWVRAHEPSIHGLEKFMDFGFINSILKSRFFPPHDMWLSPSPDPRYSGGFTINYYYFGHLTAAVLTRLSGLDSSLTYNLILATVFGLCFTGAFSIGGNLIKTREHENTRTKKQNCFHVLMFSCFNDFRILIGGLLTAFLVTLAGNLHPIYLILKDASKYWYPDATRFIPFTIHEFPAYSWVVADLHGHVFDIPFVLLAIAMLIALLNSKFEARNSKQIRNAPQKRGFLRKANVPNLKLFRIWNFGYLNLFRVSGFGFRVLLLGLVLAVLYMTNAWDGIIYLALSGLVILVTILRSKRFTDQLSKIKNLKVKSKKYNVKLKSFKILVVVFTFSILLFSFFLFSLPFNYHFHPFVKGIGVNCPPTFMPDKWGPFLFEKGNCQRSPLYMLLILWGFFFFNAAALVIHLLKNSKHAARNSKQIRNAPQKRGFLRKANVPNLKLFRIWNFGHWDLFRISDFVFRISKIELFLLLMIFVSTLLLIFPEFFYAKDIYPAHFRANTMFKLGYQAFIMLSIVSGYTIIRMINSKFEARSSKQALSTKFKVLNKGLPSLKFRIWNLFGTSNLVFRIFLIPQLFFVSIYPYYATVSYYGNLKVYHGLNGVQWLERQYPDDYQAITWLKNQLAITNYLPAGRHGQLPIIVEAVGESYTDYARVSAHTGLPTILGWPVHEWLWRGSYDEPGKRVPEVQTIYESADLDQTKQLLKKYKASYLFLGTLEREKYKELNEEKFDQLGKVVFESGETKIFEIR